MLFERSEFIERFEGFIVPASETGRFREYNRGNIQPYKKIYNIIRNNLVI